MNEKIYTFTWKITREKIKKFFEVTLNQTDLYKEESARKYGFRSIPAPPTFGTILEISAVPDFGLVVSDFGLDPIKILQYEQEYYYNDLIYVDDDITCQVKTKRQRNILIFESVFMNKQKDILISGKSKYIQPISSEKNLKAKNKSKKYDENLCIFQNLSLSKNNIKNYAEISGDYNSIHIHDSEEIRREYGGVLAHGMLLMGIASNVIPAESLKCLRYYKARFLSPAKPDERLVVLSNIVHFKKRLQDESFCGKVVIQSDTGAAKMVGEFLLKNKDYEKDDSYIK